MENNSDSLDRYLMLSVIGKGSYAKVSLIRNKSTGQLYALKSMKKKYIQKRGQAHRIMTERDILVSIRHPSLVKIHSSFQDEKKLHLVLEYCPGGELFGLLAKKKRLSQSTTRFYAIQMIMAIEYLHSKNIIYRDLKPENVLIGADGYIKLTDFGLSRNNIEGNFDAQSICGTPEYLAPEVVKKDGHGKAVDWWCLGSIIFELVNGLPPFYTKNKNVLFDRIKIDEPEMNKNWSKNLRDLLTKLLTKDPVERMKNVEQIRNHPWLNHTNWDDLMDKKIKPPFVPVLKKESDVSNFASEFTNMSPMSNTDSLSDYSNYEGFQYEIGKSPMTSPLKPVEETDLDQEILTFELA